MSNELSIGERRMRIDFKKPEPGNVYALKAKTAETINLLEDFKRDPRNEVDGETARLIATSQTNIEGAALWAVKAVTK